MAGLLLDDSRLSVDHLAQLLAKLGKKSAHLPSINPEPTP
jgi:hypothetical protein